MHIGLCGAQCVGKSTQAQILAEEYNYTLVPSASRIIAELGVPVNRNGTLSTQLQIAGQMEQQMFLTHKDVNVVWERTHIDSMAYSSSCNLWGHDIEFMSCLSTVARRQMTEYFNIVFFFPAYSLNHFSGNIDNGIRDTDPEYRASMGEFMEETLIKFNIPYNTVPLGSIDYIAGWIQDRIHEQTLDIGKHTATKVIQYMNSI